MSDEALRRRLRAETTSVEDEVAALSERLRRGDLALERVELAAYLGHPAAQLCLAWDIQDSAWPGAGNYQLLRGVSRFDKETRVRIAVAGAVSHLTRLGSGPHMAQLDLDESWETVFAAEAWVLCPCREHQALAQEAASKECFLPFGVFRAASGAAEAAWRRPTQGARAALSAAGDQARAAVETEVLPWALGLRDPLQERVERRRRARRITLDDLRTAALESARSEDGEEAYLRLRVEAGTLSRRELELAAYCGSRGACDHFEFFPTPADPEGWLAGLERWGPGAYVLAARVMVENYGAQTQAARAAAGALTAWLEGGAAREQLFRAARISREPAERSEREPAEVLSALAALVGFRATASREPLQRSWIEFQALVDFTLQNGEGSDSLDALVEAVKASILREILLPRPPRVGPAEVPAWIRESS